MVNVKSYTQRIKRGKRKNAFIVEFRENSKKRFHRGANLYQPVMYANKESAENQIDFMETEINKIRREMGKPLYENFRAKKVLISDVDAGKFNIK